MIFCAIWFEPQRRLNLKGAGAKGNYESRESAQIHSRGFA